MKIQLSNPDITDTERNAVLEVLNTPNLSIGPKIPEFEDIIKKYADVKYAVAMSSGTSVLHTIIRGMGIGKGDYVITTPFSFVSTSNCLLYESAEPIFVDIDEGTYNINPNEVENCYLALPGNIKRKVKAIIYIDTFGNPADGYGFEKLGKKHNLHIIEDSAEALGSSLKGRKCGSFGIAGLFAFYPNKQITTGEGGILLTNSEELNKMARSLRNQGRDEGGSWLQHARLGYNYRMSDINAALGIAQMSRINDLLQKRKDVKQIYNQILKDVFKNGLLIQQKELENSDTSPFVYVVRLANDFTQSDRDQILGELRNEGIQCSNYFTPIHLQPHYRELGWQYGDMPTTEKISELTIALPFYNNLKIKQIEYVCDRLLKLIKRIKL